MQKTVTISAHFCIEDHITFWFLLDSEITKQNLVAEKSIIKENAQWLPWLLHFLILNPKYCLETIWLLFWCPISMDIERLGRETGRKSIRETTGAKYIISCVSTISSTTLHIHFWVNLAFLKTLLQVATNWLFFITFIAEIHHQEFLND